MLNICSHQHVGPRFPSIVCGHSINLQVTNKFNLFSECKTIFYPLTTVFSFTHLHGVILLKKVKQYKIQFLSYVCIRVSMFTCAILASSWGTSGNCKKNYYFWINSEIFCETQQSIFIPNDDKNVQKCVRIQ